MSQAHLLTPRVSRKSLKGRILRGLGFGLLAGAALTLIPAQNSLAAPAGEFTMFDLGPAEYGQWLREEYAKERIAVQRMGMARAPG